VTSKSHKPKPARNPAPRELGRLRREIALRDQELLEARQQQAATSEVLKAISGSNFDLQAVLNTLVESAARLCGASLGEIFRWDGTYLRWAAGYALSPEFLATQREIVYRLGRDSAVGRTALNMRVTVIDDALEDPEYGYKDNARVGDVRTILGVPLLRSGELIGVLGFAHQRVEPFTERQIELVTTFADHAVIAIENARLFEELQARNRELTEALERQTATGTILRAIAASPTDVGPVLNTVVESAARLCGANLGQIFRWDGTYLRWAAGYALSPEFLETQRELIYRPGRDSLVGRTALNMRVTVIDDALEDPEYGYKEHAKIGDIRTILGVPLLRSGELIGVLALVHQRVEPFTERQIELVTTFADQAVIAIENARLFEELQGRNRELTEALEQQTATGTILRAIAASPTDVGPVLNTVAESAARLCQAYDSAILLAEGDVLVVRAHHGPIPIDFAKWPIGRDWVTGRAFTDRRPVHVHDLMQEGDEFPAGHAMAMRLGHRTMLAVPLLREDKAIGALILRRLEMRPFSQKQIDLLVLFADQAVIAIENTRLFEELQTRNRELTEAIERQTATAEVLKAISRATFDLPVVLRTLVASAARLCGATYGGIMLREGDMLRGRAIFAGTAEDEADMQSRAFRRRLVPIDRTRISGRVVLSGHLEQIPDILADPEYDSPFLARVSNTRALMGVPLLRKGAVEGVFFLGRPQPGTFTERQRELVQTFADQAVIAVENVRLFEEVKARTGELSESLQQQIATADVLKAISRSTFDLQAVLNTLVESAARLCAANIAQIFRWDGTCLRWAAGYALGPEYLEIQRERTYKLGRDSLVGRTGLEKRTTIIPDVLEDPDYAYKDHAKIGEIRTLLGVPLLRSGELIGVIALAHQRVEPFTEKQIELVTTFADQAVIAIENARLFEEVQARTRELQETLDYQTAIGEVLNVISRSPSDVQPVLDVIIETAVRLCDADGGAIVRERNGQFFGSGQVGFSREFMELMKREPVELSRGTVTGRALVDGKVVHILDAETDPEYTWTEAQKLGQLHTMLGVPLLHDKAALGAIALTRRTVRPFTDKQIELVTTFADQAVIAIENARLFEEVQARTRELEETLDYQTAIGEVLNVISRSPSDVQPVLDVILQTAVRLCDADGGTIARERDGQFLRSGQVGFSPEFTELMKREPVELARGTVTGRTLVDGKVTHILDAATDPEYTWTEAKELGQLHTLLGVPLMRDRTVIGVIALIRRSVRPFTEKQIELVTTFADQAVIAIENARLFEEVQARTSDLARSVGELKALGEVSQSVNSTLDLKTVLETIVTKAVQLSGTDAGAIYVYSRQEDRFRLKATYGMSAELIKAISDQALRLNDPGMGDAARSRQPVQAEDLSENLLSPVHKIVLDAGFRSLLIVPLLRPNKVVGALVVRRRAPGRFSDSIVHLMETFAAQSVLAIQNARLFSEIEEKSHQLEIASRHKSQFLANMSHELRTPLNSVLGFTEMLADGLYGELPEKAKATLARVQANGRHLLGLINDVLDLSKIEAGQLTLTIDDYSIGQIVRTIAATTEPLARAKGLKLSAVVGNGLPLGRGDERRLSQVLLNLVGNAVKFTESGSIEITANARDGYFEILVRDTGPGIAPEHQSRVFEEFQQVDESSTRQKGGTGLGLAISKRIVEMHGGSIGIESALGAGSTFRVAIPVKARGEMVAA
jgi:GAF domain-containing protein